MHFSCCSTQDAASRSAAALEGVPQQVGNLFERMRHLELQVRFHERPPDLDRRALEYCIDLNCITPHSTLVR